MNTKIDKIHSAFEYKKIRVINLRLHGFFYTIVCQYQPFQKLEQQYR